MCLHGVPPPVYAEQLRAASSRAVKSKQQPERGRFSGAVRPQVSVDLSLGDRQVEGIERERGVVALGWCGSREAMSSWHGEHLVVER